MGLFRTLVLLPVAPLRGVLWLAQILQEIADGELNDPQRLRDALRDAEGAHARGEISEEQLAEVEQHVLDRLIPLEGNALNSYADEVSHGE